MEILGISSIASLTVICYLAAELAKALGLEGRWLPGLCGLCGGALGLAGYFSMEAFPAPDLLSALAVGIVSGLAATGSDQLVKKLRGE